MDEQSLETYLDFSDADLAANRSGDLSPGQRASLLWSGIWRLVSGPPTLLIGILLALLNDNAGLQIGGLALAAGGLYLTWRGFAFLMDSTEGAVAFITGPMRKRSVRGRYGMTYYADIGPVSKTVTAVAYDGLREGLGCHLYYAPGCRSLLSVEPASAGEPKPPHPFGPDSAHAWNRLRLSWVAITIGVVGLVIGAHAVAVAHPAYRSTVAGTVSDYVETHGRSTSRTFYLAGDSSSYTPQSEDSYDPIAPSFGAMIGDPVTFYLDRGTSNVIAIEDGDRLYAADWYLHPEHKTVYEAVSGGISGGLSLLAIAGGIAGLLVGRRRIASAAEAAAAQVDTPESWRPLHTPPSVPPTVHRLDAAWPAFLGLSLAVAAVFLVLSLVAHR